MTMSMPLPRIASILPKPVNREAFVERLRLTGVALGQALLFVPALLLGILSLLAVPLTLVVVGLGLAHLAVPATEQLTRLHRWIAGQLLGEEIPTGYADTTGTNPVTRAAVWLRDKARWRDFAFLWFSVTGGFVLSMVVVGLLTTPVVYLIGTIVDLSWAWVLLLCLSGPLLMVWWLVTPALVRARALAERGILGHSRVEQLERRVEEVATSRSQALDHSAAEVRRIERDLHDGAQARIAAVGMNVGLAEKLMSTDPAAAAELLKEARETTVSALEDLRSVVRGIHPPVLADRGLAGAIEALTLAIPMPVTLALALDDDLPAPVESAAYFAVTECLTNIVKHADASRAWVSGTHHGSLIRLVVGDDGRGGADPTGSGFAGVARRLQAFDGTMTLTSPLRGPTVVTMELPCPQGSSSARTRPSSEPD
ncbi:histidine kinase [Nocardioides sp. Soil797]|nr:histidine kinase [Nocardioides sp. Soil797]